jgi:Family of unknown function (DUF6765)
MDIEFHCYITYVLARKGGFTEEESAVIACSSQYTDDNTQQYCINFERENQYLSIASQTMDITKPDEKRKFIYPVFHFFPGDSDSPTAERQDGLMHPFNTTPDSRNVRQMFTDALESRNPYRIGIATHVYADSWAHQNFCGCKHDFNAMQSPKGALMPNIGHADAGHDPDKVCHVWEDSRLIPEHCAIDNNQRFLEAAKNIYIAFRKTNDPLIGEQELSTGWDELKGLLSDAMSKTALMGDLFDARRKARIEAYRQICPDIPEYDKDAWRHSAVEKDPHEMDYFDRYWGRSDFWGSHWYLFQEAAKKHHDVSMKILEPLYRRHRQESRTPDSPVGVRT